MHHPPRHVMDGSARILIVEDEGITAEELFDRLTGWGHHVVGIASSASDAVDLANRERPDLILMDILLRGDPDGITAAMTIQESVDTAIVFLTAYADDQTLRRARRTKPFGYIVKPFNERELHATVEMALARQAAERETMAHQRRLHHLAGRLQRVREEEAERLSRRIHDDLGQTLTALKFSLAWIRRRVRSHEPALRERLDEATKLLDQAVYGVRDIASELRPGVLDDLGLMPAIEWLGRKLEKKAGVACHINRVGPERPVGSQGRTAGFRICQEALKNVARHADASEVSVTVTFADSELVLDIRDNGVGISHATVRSARSLGLASMKERAIAAGGRCRIAPCPGGGTLVRARLPLDGPRDGGVS